MRVDFRDKTKLIPSCNKLFVIAKDNKVYIVGWGLAPRLKTYSVKEKFEKTMIFKCDNLDAICEFNIEVNNEKCYLYYKKEELFLQKEVSLVDYKVKISHSKEKVYRNYNAGIVPVAMPGIDLIENDIFHKIITYIELTEVKPYHALLSGVKRYRGYFVGDGDLQIAYAVSFKEDLVK